MEMCQKRLNSFDENIKWIMLFIFSSKEHPMMMGEVQPINSFMENISDDIDVFWEPNFFNHECDTMKIYFIIGN